MYVRNPNQTASRAEAIAMVVFMGAVFSLGLDLDGWFRAGWLLGCAPLVAVTVLEARRWVRASPAERRAMRSAELSRRALSRGESYREPTPAGRVTLVVVVALGFGLFVFVFGDVLLQQLLGRPPQIGFAIAWLALWTVGTALGVRGAIKFEP